MLGTFLLRKGQLTVQDLELALAEQERSGEPIGQVLVGLGFITTRHLAEALAEQHSLAFLDLGAMQLDEETVTLLPESAARRYQALPVEVQDGTIVVAVADPTNLLAHDDLPSRSAPTRESSSPTASSSGRRSTRSTARRSVRSKPSRAPPGDAKRRAATTLARLSSTRHQRSGSSTR